MRQILIQFPPTPEEIEESVAFYWAWEAANDLRAELEEIEDE